MKNLILIAVSIIFLGVSQEADSKSKYQKLDSSEGVTFYYKWKSSKSFEKDSPLVLLLKIENDNNHAVQTDFVVDYFWDALRKASSPDLSFCIKSGKKIKGKLDKLGFDRADFSNEDILSDRFILELSGIKVTKSAGCQKKE